MYTVFGMKATFFQLVRFGIVGASNMALDAVIYIALTRTIPFFERYFLVAAFVAFVISAANSFVWNKHWSFKDKVKFSKKQLLKFYIASATALAINEGVLWTLVHEFEVFDIYAKLIASVSAGGINFVLQKFWIFRGAGASATETKIPHSSSNLHTQSK